MPLHRVGDITFYEELGLENSASSDQIRDAYRALVRLLHPDQQTDPQLKEIAEMQMRKLNRIYSILSDAERRRHYDTILTEQTRPAIVFRPANPMTVRRLLARFAWIGAVVVSVLFLIWLASEGTAGPQVQAYEKGLAAPTPLPSRTVPFSLSSQGDPTEDINQLRSELRATRAERDAAIRELSRLRGTATPAGTGEPPHASLSPAPPQTAAIQEVPAPPRASTPGIIQPVNAQPAASSPPGATRQFAGFWFYSRPSRGQHNQNHTLYPPDYIEATLREQNGIIYGKYRSRYQIADRAISPDVNFEFNGTPAGTTIACVWSGSGGSRGDLTIRLIAENTIRIDWTANELGTAQGLSSGTAILNRRVE